MDKIAVILVHGFNVTNSQNTVGKLLPYFEEYGCIVEEMNYGYWPFTWQLVRRNPKEAARLASRVQHWHDKGYRVVVANHSNGAAITYLATHDTTYKAPVWRVLSFHPALDRDVHPCQRAEKVFVVHNQGDLAVVAGSWLSAVVAFLTPKRYQARPWGQMGQDGFQGKAPNVWNIDTGDAKRFDPPAWGHSDEFSEGKEKQFLPLLVAVVLGVDVEF